MGFLQGPAIRFGQVYERGTGETFCGTVRLRWRAFVGACLMRVSTFKPLAAA
jgi:hypothetical protein